MPDPSSSIASGNDQSRKVMIKDVLKPAILIIALTISVVFILLVWYFSILKPALIEGISIDISLTKKLPSNTPLSQELKPHTEVKTSLNDDHLEPLREELKEEKSEAVQHDNPTQRPHPNRRSNSVKSVKSHIARIKKEPTIQSQDSLLPDNHEMDNKKTEVSVESIRTEGNIEKNKDEDAVQKIKSFADKLKESFLIPATQPTCTQVQIAMNQCPN